MAELLNAEANSSVDTIQYYVVENPAATKLKGEPVYTGVVKIKESYAINDVIERMAAEGCAVKGSTIRLVLTEFSDLVGRLVSEGRAVNLNGVVRFAPAIRGTFANGKADFDAERNSVVVNATAGSRLRLAAVGSPVAKVPSAALPTLAAVYNLSTGSQGTICSEGGILVTGTKLEWDADTADEGFFLNYEGVQTKFSVTGVPSATAVALVTGQAMEEGDTAELWFRTRMGGDTLYQVRLADDLVCEAEDDEP